MRPAAQAVLGRIIDSNGRSANAANSFPWQSHLIPPSCLHRENLCVAYDKRAAAISKPYSEIDTSLLADAMVAMVLLLAIIIVWGVEQVALARVTTPSIQDYFGRTLAIALAVGVVCVVAEASPIPVGAVLAAVIVGHGLVTAPLLLTAHQKRAGNNISSPAQRGL